MCVSPVEGQSQAPYTFYLQPSLAHRPPSAKRWSRSLEIGEVHLQGIFVALWKIARVKVIEMGYEE